MSPALKGFINGILSHLWRSEAEHATSRSQRLPTISNLSEREETLCFLETWMPGAVFSYKLRYIVGFGLVEMGIQLFIMPVDP